MGGISQQLVGQGARLFVQIMEENDQYHPKERGKRFKLSAKAYRAASIATAETTEDKLQALRARLESPRWEEVAQALRLLVKETLKPEIGHPLDMMAINQTLSRFEDAVFLLTRDGYSKDELAALAAIVATENHPEAFGPIDDPAAHEAKLQARKARAAEIEKTIQDAVTLEDCVFDPNDNARWLKRWPEVALDPVDTLGKRLVEYVGMHLHRKIAIPDRAAAIQAKEAEAEKVAHRTQMPNVPVYF